jgi:hypothetical protein
VWPVGANATRGAALSAITVRTGGSASGKNAAAAALRTIDNVLRIVKCAGSAVLGKTVGWTGEGKSGGGLE